MSPVWQPEDGICIDQFMANVSSQNQVTFFEELQADEASAVISAQSKKQPTASRKHRQGSLTALSFASHDQTCADITANSGHKPRIVRKRKRSSSRVLNEPAESGDVGTVDDFDEDSDSGTCTPRQHATAAAVLAVGEGRCDSSPTAAEVTTVKFCDTSAWRVLFVPVCLRAALAQLNFSEPTEIQRLCLPAAIKGRRDIIGAAETGSGKTLAYGLPLLYGVLKNITRLSVAPAQTTTVLLPGECESGDLHIFPLALVLTPTRELALQVRQHLTAAARFTSVKIVAVVGGLCEQKQLRQLSRGAHVLVATPGRLWQLVDTGAHRALTALHRLRFLVVDEADRMIEKGHFEQLDLLLQRINSDDETRAARQNFVFSATLAMTPTVVADNVASSKQRSGGKHKRNTRDGRCPGKQPNNSCEDKLQRVIEQIGVRRNNVKVVDITSKTLTARKLVESAVSCSIEQKDVFLYYFLLQHPARTLIFCNSIDCVTRLARLLTCLDLGPLSLHAGQQQRQRLKTLRRFVEADVCPLLATDVAARGLDIAHVRHVLHYNVPRTAEIYVHRSGRTARANNDGLSVMLVEPGEVPAYGKLLRQLRRDTDLPAFTTVTDTVDQLRQHVCVARQLCLIEHRWRRRGAATGANKWRHHVAANVHHASVHGDDSDDSSDSCADADCDADETAARAEKQQRQQLAQLRQHLRQLVRQRELVWQPRTHYGTMRHIERHSSAMDAVRRKAGDGMKSVPVCESSPACETEDMPRDESVGEKRRISTDDESDEGRAESSEQHCDVAVLNTAAEPAGNEESAEHEPHSNSGKNTPDGSSPRLNVDGRPKSDAKLNGGMRHKGLKNAKRRRKAKWFARAR